MKILADTNILISALLWPHSKPAAALLHAARFHELVLCDRIIFELRDVLGRKAPQALTDVEVFLAELAYVFFLVGISLYMCRICKQYPPRNHPVLHGLKDDLVKDFLKYFGVLKPFMPVKADC